MSNSYMNPDVLKAFEGSGPGRDPWSFHKRMPEYMPTPLIDAREAARDLGISRVWVKDESNRLGLPSFKILGACWAVYRALMERFDVETESWEDLEQLKETLSRRAPLTLVAATDGNHGRAVARTALWFGFNSEIFVPKGTVQARIDAIESEGARVMVVDGDYDRAVAVAAGEDAPGTWLIQDTGWPGYETIPSWIVEGYSTMFWEIEEQLEILKESPPDIVVVQIGVGSLAASAAGFYRSGGRGLGLKIVGVEPEGAACAFESVKAGRIVSIRGPHPSAMAGLNCGTISSVAWPALRLGVDAFVVVGNARAFEAMRLLAADGIVSGESGAAGLAGLMEIIRSGTGESFREGLGLNQKSSVLVISTEGITDPDMYKRVVG